MAFHVFLEEQVDVVILEVGIGGEYDPTNIIRSPVVCGITSLEIDHVRTLGDSLEIIAWHKSGIFKNGSYALTVTQQDCAMKVLERRSIEKECPLAVVPSSIYSYDWGGAEQTLGIPGEKQELNASLAVQLCLVWTTLHGKSLQDRKVAWQDLINKTATRTGSVSKTPTIQLPDIVVQGLQKCHWPGRCQTIKKPGITFYLDTAHTPESVKSTERWFEEASMAEANTIQGEIVKVLMFNVTRDRKVEPLLTPLLICCFDFAIFCPHKISTEGKPDTSSRLSVCQDIMKTWEALAELHNSTLASTRKQPDESVENHDNSSKDMINMNEHDQRIQPLNSMSFGCVLEALRWVIQGRTRFLLQTPHKLKESADHIHSADHIQVLCTGCPYMVGSVLRLIHPDVCDEVH